MSRPFQFNARMMFVLLASTTALLGVQKKAPPTSANTLKPALIVRSANNLQDAASVKTLVQMAKNNGIESLIVGVKQDEDHEFPSGTVFYRSKLAPAANPSFDALKAVLFEAHHAGITVSAWVPQFHDQIAFYRGGKNPEGYLWAMKTLINGKAVDYTFTGTGATPAGQSKDFFVNPCSKVVRNYQRELIRELVQNYDVDGIVLDWIRFDGWKMDMGQSTIADFQKSNPKVDPKKIDFSELDLKKNTDLASWQQWRCQKIGEHVKDIYEDIQKHRKGLPLGIFILPPEFLECGQDPVTFKDYVNYVSPMCYFKDWSFGVNWVCQGALADVAVKIGASKPITPALDAPPFHTKEEYRTITTSIRAGFPSIKEVYFFTYGKWNESQLKQISDIKFEESRH